MQKSNNEVVESVLMAIPADLLEEVGIDLYSTIQMSVSRGRIIIEPVDEEVMLIYPKSSLPHFLVFPSNLFRNGKTVILFRNLAKS